MARGVSTVFVWYTGKLLEAAVRASLIDEGGEERGGERASETMLIEVCGCRVPLPGGEEEGRGLCVVDRFQRLRGRGPWGAARFLLVS